MTWPQPARLGPFVVVTCDTVGGGDVDGSVLLARAVLVHAALTTAGIPNAYGGDLALVLCGVNTRPPLDLVVHVTVDPRRPGPAFTALRADVPFSTADVAQAVRDGQVRLLWPVRDEAPIPVELFLPQHSLHAVAAGRTSAISVAGASIPVLAATDLVTLLMLSDRARDLADLEELLSLGAVDVEEVSRWLIHLVGADDPRLARLGAATEPREIPIAAMLFKRKRKPEPSVVAWAGSRPEVRRVRPSRLETHQDLSPENARQIWRWWWPSRRRFRGARSGR